MRAECNYKTEAFLLVCTKRRVSREKFVCVIVSTFLIFLFFDLLLLVDVISQLYYLTTIAEKSIISICHSNLVYRFSPISVIKYHFIATDFYQLTTPGYSV